MFAIVTWWWHIATCFTKPLGLLLCFVWIWTGLGTFCVMHKMHSLVSYNYFLGWYYDSPWISITWNCRHCVCVRVCVWGLGGWGVWLFTLHLSLALILLIWKRPLLISFPCTGSFVDFSCECYLEQDKWEEVINDKNKKVELHIWWLIVSNLFLYFKITHYSLYFQIYFKGFILPFDG